MRPRQLFVAVVVAWLALAGCNQPAVPKELQPTVANRTYDPGPHACRYVVDAEARTALGRETRKAASTTANANTFCTYRTEQKDTDLIVTGGGGGTASFNLQLANAEQDMKAKRAAVPGVTDGFLVSGTQLGSPIVLVGAIRGPHWFTAILRVKGSGRSTLEDRAVVVLKAGVGRLET